MLTKSDIIEVAMAQSAVDLGCNPADFTSGEDKIVTSTANPNARRYLTLPFPANLVSYGGNIVASVSEQFRKIIAGYIRRFHLYECFETPAVNVLADLLQPLGYGVCFMAEYWLPDLSRLTPLPCKYRIELLTSFDGLYLPQWSNALCEKRRELDVLGVGAYDGERMVGLAGCSSDCETMYQIGVDVLPEYRCQGIASALTSRLAVEILSCDKVPFYCCAWSNVRSAKNAVRSGFFPAWVEMTVKSMKFIDKMNNKIPVQMNGNCQL